MLINRSHTIIYLSESSLVVGRVILGKSPRVTLSEPYALKADELPKTLNFLKKKYGSRIRLLIADECAYVFAHPFEKEPTREAVLEAATGTIPENIDDIEWTYTFHKGTIQIAAYRKYISDIIKKGFLTAGYRIDSIEAASLALARHAKTTQPALIVQAIQNGVQFVAVSGEVVYAVEQREQEFTSDHLEQFIRYVNDKFGIILQSLIAVGIDPAQCAVPAFPQITVTTASFNPFIGAALNEGRQDSRHPSETKHHIYRRVAIVGLIMVITTSLGGGWLAMNRFQFTRGEEVAVVTPTIAPQASTPTSTPQPAERIDLALYPIVIQNGSGIAGEASRLERVLTENGFSVEGVGNADAQDYESTYIRHPDTVPGEVINNLDIILQKLYTKVIAEPAVTTDSAEIVIIIGEKQ